MRVVTRPLILMVRLYYLIKEHVIINTCCLEKKPKPVKGLGYRLMIDNACLIQNKPVIIKVILSCFFLILQPLFLRFFR